MLETPLLFMIGCIGVIIHCLLKAESLCKDAKVANVNFGFKEYLNSDWKGILISFLSVVVWILLFGETAKKYPLLEDWVRSSFFGMGLMGSYLIQTFTSKAKSRIRAIVDDKTNELDKLKE